ncbi:hypothetical protein DITRI_Ditri11bG0164900 [Diplodiscus trichospermus]
MDPVLLIAALSVVLGAFIAFVFFKSYLLKQRSEVQTIAKPELPSDPKKPSKPSQPISKKSRSSDLTKKKNSHSNLTLMPLTRKSELSKRLASQLRLILSQSHVDSVTRLCFSSDGRNLATACSDGVVRVYKLEDASSKSFKFLRINLPVGGHLIAVAFSDDASSIVQTKLPLPQIKWERHKIHQKQAVLTLTGSTASYGTIDESTIIASCSEGTDIILWHGRTGKVLGHVDTNQLKNTMATISPNGRFLAAAAFTADVKILDIKHYFVEITILIYHTDSLGMNVLHIELKSYSSCLRYLLDEDPKT